MDQLGCILWLSLCLHATHVRASREKDLTVTDNDVKQPAEAVSAWKHPMDRQRGRREGVVCAQRLLQRQCQMWLPVEVGFQVTYCPS